jgi:hypothetical protein
MTDLIKSHWQQIAVGFWAIWSVFWSFAPTPQSGTWYAAVFHTAQFFAMNWGRSSAILKNGPFPPLNIAIPRKPIEPPKRLIIVGCILLLSASFSRAQSPAPAQPAPATIAPTFSLNATVLSLSGSGQTTPAMDIGATFAVNKVIWLRSDNLIGPGANLNANLASLQYALPLCGLLKSTNLNCNNFGFYAVAGAGANHVTSSSSGTSQHFCFQTAFGVNRDLTGSGKYTLNLFEIKYMKLPGFNNNAVSVSGGILLGLF